MRLLDLGMDPMNFADSLLGIVAQRLVRVAVPALRAPGAAAPRAIRWRWSGIRAGLALERGRRRQAACWPPPAWQTPEEVALRHAVGCDHCGGKGYKGRMGIYEILQNSRGMQLLIQRNARPTEIYEAAVGAGMRSLRHDALEKWCRA